MKTTWFLAVTTCWMAAGLLPAQDYIVKERAKGLRDQNNARQGVPNPPSAPLPVAPGQAASAPAPPNPPSGISPAAQQNISALQLDLAALTAKPPQPKPALAKDLLSAVLTTAKPSQESVIQLSLDLEQALAGREISVPNQTRLARDLNAIINCGALPQETIQKVVADAQVVLQDGGAKHSDATSVADDLKTVASEVKKAAAK